MKHKEREKERVERSSLNRYLLNGSVGCVTLVYTCVLCKKIEFQGYCGN